MSRSRCRASSLRRSRSWLPTATMLPAGSSSTLATIAPVGHHWVLMRQGVPVSLMPDSRARGAAALATACTGIADVVAIADWQVQPQSRVIVPVGIDDLHDHLLKVQQPDPVALSVSCGLETAVRQETCHWADECFRHAAWWVWACAPLNLGRPLGPAAQARTQLPSGGSRSCAAHACAGRAHPSGGGHSGVALTRVCRQAADRRDGHPAQRRTHALGSGRVGEGGPARRWALGCSVDPVGRRIRAGHCEADARAPAGRLHSIPLRTRRTRARARAAGIAQRWHSTCPVCRAIVQPKPPRSVRPGARVDGL